MSLELCYMPVANLLESYRNKQLSPVEVLDAQLARAQATEPTVNCLSFTYFDEARKQAKKAEHAYLTGAPRALEGITVAIKDEPMIAGYPTQNGSHVRAGFVASHTDPICERLLQAGAIVHARTTTPEFSIHYCTWNNVTGVTRNPWNPDLTVGGSSGGSGAALASGITTLASGSDIAGSIRIPAAFNGTVGFKPPFGRVPELPPFSTESYAASGPLGRCVEDILAMQQIIAGPHQDDLYCLPAYDLLGEHKPVREMKIALCMNLGFYRVEQEVQDAINAAANRLRAQGCAVVEVDLAWNKERTLATLETHIQLGMGGVLKAEIDASGIEHDQLTPYVRHFALGDNPPSALQALDCQLHSGEMLAALNASVFGQGFDALLCPTMATMNISADYDPFNGDQVLIDGQAVESWMEPVMTFPFNILGRFPVVNVPVGLGSHSVPIGMQIVGPKLEDRVPFAIAKALEAASPNLFDSPPLV